MKIASCLIALVFMATVHNSSASDVGQEVSEQKDYERKAYTHAEVHSTGVSSPLKRFLLVRKGNDGCAIRFTKFWRDSDETEPTAFSSGQENVYAEYECYHQGDGSFDFTKGNVVHVQGKLHDGPSFGIGRAAFKLGLTFRIQCGSFWLFWRYPTRLLFKDYDGLRDKNVEISPSKWQELNEVNFNDDKLLWFRYSEKRQHQYILLDDLP